MTRINEDVAQFIELSGRDMPHSKECEDLSLGAVFNDNGVINSLVNQLKTEDYYVPANKKIFAAMSVLASRNSEISPTLVTDILRQEGELESVGGKEYVDRLAEQVAYTELSNYVDVIKRHSLSRKIYDITTKASIAARQGKIDPDDLLAQTESALFTLDEAARQDFEHVGPVGQRVLENVQEIQGRGTGLSGLTTGLEQYDKMTTGLQKQDLIIVAARPSMGKTGFALKLASSAAMRAGATVAIFSLEMSKEALLERLFSAESRVDSQKLRNGTLSKEEWARLSNSLGVLSTSKIFIDDTGMLNPAEIAAKSRRLASEQKGLDLIIVDYLQLMSGGQRVENRQQEITFISRQLKALAKAMNCPVVALSQLSRAPEARSDHRPVLADLRESGAIEQDADVVSFIYREEKYNPTPDNEGITELITAKQRKGPTGTIRLSWTDKFTRFDNLWIEGAE